MQTAVYGPWREQTADGGEFKETFQFYRCHSKPKVELHKLKTHLKNAVCTFGRIALIAMSKPSSDSDRPSEDKSKYNSVLFKNHVLLTHLNLALKCIFIWTTLCACLTLRSDCDLIASFSSSHKEDRMAKGGCRPQRVTNKSNEDGEVDTFQLWSEQQLSTGPSGSIHHGGWR